MKFYFKIIMSTFLYAVLFAGLSWAAGADGYPEKSEIDTARTKYTETEKKMENRTPEIPDSIQDKMDKLKADRQAMKTSLVELLKSIQGAAAEEKREKIEAWKEENTELITDIRERASELREKIIDIKPDLPPRPRSVDFDKDLARMRERYKKKAQEMMDGYDSENRFDPSEKSKDKWTDFLERLDELREMYSHPIPSPQGAGYGGMSSGMGTGPTLPD